jgi:Phospholipase_D-nuclease N-terminal
MTMDAMTTSFGEVLLWSFWFFIWLCALMVWFRCVIHLFQDDSLRGWAKAGWVVLLVLLPWLGGLIYIIARGRIMGERVTNDAAQAQAEQERYIRQVAGSTSPSPADQIASAKSLLDTGTITQSEFDALKANALT